MLICYVIFFIAFYFHTLSSLTFYSGVLFSQTLELHYARTMCSMSIYAAYGHFLVINFHKFFFSRKSQK